MFRAAFEEGYRRAAGLQQRTARRGSGRNVLWRHFTGQPGRVTHSPDVGPVTLACDVLTVPGSDLRIVAYTAPSGGDAAGRLKLLAVIGTQAMAGRPG